MFPLSQDEIGILELSLRVAVVSVACSLPLAILVAYGLARFSFPGKTLVDAIVHLPLVLPPVVVGFALLVLFGKHGAKEVPFAGYYLGVERITNAVITEYGQPPTKPRNGISYHWLIQPVIVVAPESSAPRKM